MPVPTLNPVEVEAAIPAVKIDGPPLKGGQKLVFPVLLDGTRYALKLLACKPAPPPGMVDADGNSIEPLDEAFSRAAREYQIMEDCKSPHLVKPGPISLSRATIGSNDVVYFAEEWIDGSDLKATIANGPLTIQDVVLLGRHLCAGISELWDLAKVHRDIKPGNVMRRKSGEFVLLDLGLALDLDDESLTATGMVPGTPIYLSPEQMDLTRKRSLDFRSDLFAAGVVMYEAATGRHPFCRVGMSTPNVIGAILYSQAEKPSTLRPDIPVSLEAIILRLLAKQPHLRYRRCTDLEAALAAVH